MINLQQPTTALIFFSRLSLIVSKYGLFNWLHKLNDSLRIDVDILSIDIKQNKKKDTNDS